MREHRHGVGARTAVDVAPAAHPAPGKQTLVQLAADPAATPGAPASAAASPGGGAPLPAGLQARMEGSFGADFSSVRVHQGDHAQELGALAYAQGTDLHFAPGQYQPDSPTGQALIGHELAHVVQQRDGRVAAPAQAKGAPVVADPGLEAEADHAGQAAARGEPASLPGRSAASPSSAPAALPKLVGHPIQCFGSQEHQSLGDTATGSASYDVGGGPGDAFQLTHGDIVALSGDYFLAGPGTSSAGGRGQQDDLFYLAGRPGNRGQAAGTRDEVIWTLKLIRGNDARFAQGGAWAGFVFSDAVKAAVNERYQRLAAANTTHFAAPRGRDAAGQPNPSPEGSAGSSYRGTHEAALRMAFQAGQRHEPVDRAMAMEAAAQHYLTDAFSAGHLRTPIGDLREYWGGKYPLFWYNLRHKMALDTAIRLNDQSTNLTTILGTVNQMYNAISQQIEAMASSLPAVTLGDLLSKVFHDRDNVEGLDVQGGGRVYGDDNLDNPDPRNQTRALAQGAIRDGNADVQTAYRLGGQAAGATSDDQIYTQVRAATATGAQYLAETRMPVPATSEAAPNWRAGSLDELWTRTVVGTSGPTVGAKIVEALQPGHEIRQTLEDLANRFPETDSRWSGNLQPRRAYRDGFLAPLVADPHAGLDHIIDWAPNYGLASNSRDDQSLASGQELDRGHQLGGMTTTARIAYINELLDGYTAEDEGALVVRVFETAAAGERRGMYRQIEGHDWNGDFRHGVFVSDDKLWNSLTSGQLTQLRGIING
ncbi:MAG TPA: DUF4157 domain-containing protein [Kofleriaceae bacterium]|jgi:hypothetical protein|nr:DUF4157 domain-containing protein [Kofleriaceae bacterium]